MSNARSFSGKKGQMVLPGGNCENMIALTQLLLKANNICISLEGLTQVLKHYAYNAVWISVPLMKVIAK